MNRLLVGTLVLFAAVAGPAQAKLKIEPRVSYDPTGVCSAEGINVFVNATFKGGEKKAAAIRKQYAPRGKGKLSVGGRTYVLTPNRAADSSGEGYAFWAFKTITVSMSEGKALLGQRARVTYETKKRTISKSTKVVPAACG